MAELLEKRVKRFLETFNFSNAIRRVYLDYYQLPEEMTSKIANWSITHQERSIYGEDSYTFTIEGEVYYEISYQGKSIERTDPFILDLSFDVVTNYWDTKFQLTTNEINKQVLIESSTPPSPEDKKQKWTTILEQFMHTFNPSESTKRVYQKSYKAAEKLTARIKSWSVSKRHIRNTGSCVYYIEGELEYQVHYKKSASSHNTYFCLQLEIDATESQCFIDFEPLGLFNTANYLLSKYAFDNESNSNEPNFPLGSLIVGKSIDVKELRLTKYFINSLQKYLKFKEQELGVYNLICHFSSHEKSLFIGYLYGNASAAIDLEDEDNESYIEKNRFQLPGSTQVVLSDAIAPKYFSNYKQMVQKKLPQTFWDFISKLAQLHIKQDIALLDTFQLGLIALGFSSKAKLVFGKKYILEDRDPREELEIAEELGLSIHSVTLMDNMDGIALSRNAVEGLYIESVCDNLITIEVDSNFLNKHKADYLAYLKRTGEKLTKSNQPAYYILTEYMG